ncbi:Major Facilitator Superfamily protein [Andreprevotia lacus DSM 23236]|jgi:MFS family permease|uniref:Major Facilitator Superfamily protein n=1 Tax=Andreprevotia lacus DSM 23236 TaxID=1121001 RepID=A0A1W1XU73_9NEIS|nr:MFS transporter [Andreprevotia lacus]SMC27530.1 Major Facilitator Superfamily protein [Andreprevotia lacus DSM 23236]
MLARHPEMGRIRVYLFGLVAGLVTGIDFIAAAMIGIAGSHIRGGVHASPEEYLWAISAYAASAIVANLVIGRLAQRISYRSYTLLSLAVFVAGSLACAMSDNISQLVLARVLQGLGGGGLFTAARVIVQVVSQPKERLALFWGFGIGANGMMAVAPWISAELVMREGWSSVFLLQAGAAALLLPLVWLLYPRRTHAPGERAVGHLDWPAVLAMGLGALLLLHGLQDLRYLRPGGVAGLVPWMLAGAAIVAFIAARLHRHPDPWLDVRRLGSRRYLAGLGFYGLFYLINGCWSFLLSSFLQDGLGYDFATTGLLLTLGGLATVCCTVIHTWQFPRVFGKRRVIAAGFAVLVLVCLWLAHAAMPGASTQVIVPAILLQGTTFVLIMVQVASMTYLDFDEADFAHAYQLKNIMREVASALGLGMTSLLLQDVRAEARTDLVSRFDHATLDAFQPGGISTATLAQWSAEIDRQASLIASDHVFVGLAVLAAIAGTVALLQRALR